MENIKAIILDVDGVIVGEKIGVNSPSPHDLVIKKLQDIKEKGISISLCTAKPHFSIADIIEKAGLDNLHITDGGGVIIDPINNLIVEEHIINKEIAKKVLSKYIDNNVYVEFYTTEDYFVQENQVSKITEGHTHVLQRKPKKLSNIAEESVSFEIAKIMPIAKDETDKERLIEIFEEFESELTLSWGVHPVILPLQFGIITALGISKKNGAQKISEHSNIEFENMLGVGDSKSDWQFIELCKFGAAMGNAKQDLKNLVLSKGEFGYIGPTVDEHGILDILDHFIR